jgi:Ca2+/Na+ antiporter
LPEWQQFSLLLVLAMTKMPWPISFQETTVWTEFVLVRPLACCFFFLLALARKQPSEKQQGENKQGG